MNTFHYLMWIFTTNLLFILRACCKLLYVYEPLGQWLQGQMYGWKLKLMNMRNRVKSVCSSCPFMSSRNPRVNEGEYKALIHYLKRTDICFIPLTDNELFVFWVRIFRLYTDMFMIVNHLKIKYIVSLVKGTVFKSKPSGIELKEHFMSYK